MEATGNSKTSLNIYREKKFYCNCKGCGFVPIGCEKFFFYVRRYKNTVILVLKCWQAALLVKHFHTAYFYLQIKFSGQKCNHKIPTSTCFSTSLPSSRGVLSKVKVKLSRYRPKQAHGDPVG